MRQQPAAQQESGRTAQRACRPRRSCSSPRCSACGPVHTQNTKHKFRSCITRRRASCLSCLLGGAHVACVVRRALCGVRRVGRAACRHEHVGLDAEGHGVALGDGIRACHAATGTSASSPSPTVPRSPNPLACLLAGLQYPAASTVRYPEFGYPHHTTPQRYCQDLELPGEPNIAHPSHVVSTRGRRAREGGVPPVAITESSPQPWYLPWHTNEEHGSAPPHAENSESLTPACDVLRCTL